MLAVGRRRWWGERRRHSLTCTGTTPAVTFPPTCLAHFAAGGEGRAQGQGRQVWGYPTWASSGVRAACLQCFGLLKGEGAVRSQSWKAKLPPILSNLTLVPVMARTPLPSPQSPHSC